MAGMGGKLTLKLGPALLLMRTPSDSANTQDHEDHNYRRHGRFDDQAADHH
jgi:hypothetical protein